MSQGAEIMKGLREGQRTRCLIGNWMRSTRSFKNIENIETSVKKKLQCFPFSVKMLFTETSLTKRCIVFLICQDRKHFYGELNVDIVKPLFFASHLERLLSLCILWAALLYLWSAVICSSYWWDHEANKDCYILELKLKGADGRADHLCAPDT